jgi:hypothetical protein
MDETHDPNLSSDAATSADELELTVIHHGTHMTLAFPQDATITDLSDRVASEFSIPPANQKFLIAKGGLQKPPSFHARSEEDHPHGQYIRRAFYS